MLPRLDAFLSGIRLFTRRRHPKPAALDEHAIADALAEAARLSAGHEQDEPAALFFACARRSRAFGQRAHDLVLVVARNHARALGFQLDVDDVVLAILHARVALHAIAFEELRDAFAAALRPAGEEPEHPLPKRRD